MNSRLRNLLRPLSTTVGGFRRVLLTWLMIAPLCQISSAAPIPDLTADASRISVTPAAVSLTGNFSEAQLLVAQASADANVDKRSKDLTQASTYLSSNDQIVAVSASGRMLAVGNGTATVTVTNGDQSQAVMVTVIGIEEQPKISFDSHIRPIISRLGCNAGACHASQFGKGGFVLSVVGFDADMDYNSMVRDRLQRRISMVKPEEILLLMKPTLQVAHGGGKKLATGSTP